MSEAQHGSGMQSALRLAGASCKSYGGIALVVCATLVTRLWLLPDVIEDRDGLFFTRAIEHYSVVHHRPHWPGYPVYIGLGKLVDVFVTNPPRALHILSALSISLATLPIAAVARGWRQATGATRAQGDRSALAAALIWNAVPMTWIDGTEIFSDPSAVLIACTMLWMCWRSVDLNAARPWTWCLGASAIAGLMLGTRLSYAPLLAPIAYTCWVRRGALGTSHRVPLIWLAAAGCFIVAVGAWLGWQIGMDGYRWVDAARRHLTGHFAGWGQSAVTDRALAQRPVHMVETFVVLGLGGWWPGTGALRLAATGLWLLAGTVGIRRLVRNKCQTPAVLCGAWTATYAAWIVLSHDVNLGRYYLPLVAMSCVLAGVSVPTASRMMKGLWWASAMTLASVTAPLALEHRSSLPWEHQQVEFFSQLPAKERAALLTDDSVLLVKSMMPRTVCLPADVRNLTTQVEQLAKRGHTVYVPEHVLEAGAVNREPWRAAVRLCRNPYMRFRGMSELRIMRFGATESVVGPLECFRPVRLTSGSP